MNRAEVIRERVKDMRQSKGVNFTVVKLDLQPIPDGGFLIAGPKGLSMATSKILEDGGAEMLQDILIRSSNDKYFMAINGGGSGICTYAPTEADALVIAMRQKNSIAYDISKGKLYFL